MPLSINVGLSRKASRNYQSAGVSINVSAELDQSLLAKPDELQRQIGDLYAHAESALEQQAAGMSHSAPSSQAGYSDRRPRRNDGGYNRGNGNGNGYRRNNGNGQGNGGDMTASQHRAIDAIAGRLNIDPIAEARDVVGEELEHLTVRQASDLIDHLKAIQPADERNGH